MTEEILEFLSDGKLLQQLNATMISLILKIDVPQMVSQFRPIFCCNVLCKCISKVICKRLRRALSSLVAENQAVFF